MIIIEIDKYPVDEPDMLYIGLGDEYTGVKGIMIHKNTPGTIEFTLHALEGMKETLKGNQERLETLKKVLAGLIAGEVLMVKDKNGSIRAYIKSEHEISSNHIAE